MDRLVVVWILEQRRF